jgi:hypothetical protein
VSPSLTERSTREVIVQHGLRLRIIAGPPEGRENRACAGFVRASESWQRGDGVSRPPGSLTAQRPPGDKVERAPPRRFPISRPAKGAQGTDQLRLPAGILGSRGVIGRKPLHPPPPGPAMFYLSSGRIGEALQSSSTTGQGTRGTMQSPPSSSTRGSATQTSVIPEYFDYPYNHGHLMICPRTAHRSDRFGLAPRASSAR